MKICKTRFSTVLLTPARCIALSALSFAAAREMRRRTTAPFSFKHAYDGVVVE